MRNRPRGARPRAARRLQLRLERLRGRQPLAGTETHPGPCRRALTHSHADGYCSITGGYVIRDRSLGPALYGKYVYGDYCDGGLRVAALRGPAAHARGSSARACRGSPPSARTGTVRVYAISLAGPVYRRRARGARAVASRYGTGHAARTDNRNHRPGRQLPGRAAAREGLRGPRDGPPRLHRDLPAARAHPRRPRAPHRATCSTSARSATCSERGQPEEIYNLAAMSFVAASWSQPVLTAEFTAWA